MVINREAMDKLAELIAEPGNFTQYLDLLKDNYTMSPPNVMLLFRQGAKGTVCGLGALIAAGINPGECAGPYTVMTLDASRGDCPVIPVNAYAVPARKKKRETEVGGMVKRIIARTGCRVEAVPKEGLPNPALKAEYDPEKRMLSLLNGVKDAKADEAALSAYLRSGIEDTRYMLPAVEYAVFGYFGIRKRINNAVFTGLKDSVNMVDFLKELGSTVYDAICRLDGAVLGFEETAIVSYLLSATRGKEGFMSSLETLMTRAGNDTKHYVEALSEKINRPGGGVVDGFLKAGRNIYTYPPYNLEKEDF